VTLEPPWKKETEIQIALFVSCRKNLAGEIWQVKRQADEGRKGGMNAHHTSPSVLDNSDNTRLMRSDGYSSVKWDLKRRKMIQAHIFPVLGIDFVFISQYNLCRLVFRLINIIRWKKFLSCHLFLYSNNNIKQNHFGKANSLSPSDLLQKRDKVLRSERYVWNRQNPGLITNLNFSVGRETNQ
jgi:hypothetical protein